eukprot:3491637-Pyramimonas_sp.AAC.1
MGRRPQRVHSRVGASGLPDYGQLGLGHLRMFGSSSVSCRPQERAACFQSASGQIYCSSLAQE